MAGARWSSPRRLALAVALVATALGCAYLACYGLALRSFVRGQIAYHGEMEGLTRDYERRMRERIPALGEMVEQDRAGGTLADEVYELLRVSPAAANSREVDRWRGQPDSPERTKVALKWARLAADEAGYLAALHARWKRDYELHGRSHDIASDEIRPPDLPYDSKWHDIPGSPPTAPRSPEP